MQLSRRKRALSFLGLLSWACLAGTATAETVKTVEWKADEGLKGATVRVPNEGDGTVDGGQTLEALGSCAKRGICDNAGTQQLCLLGRERAVQCTVQEFVVGRPDHGSRFQFRRSSPSRWRAENSLDFTVFSGTPSASAIST